MKNGTNIAPKHLINFVAEVYKSAGLLEEHARLAADTLVQADLWGHQSHGVMRLPWYVARLRDGVVRSVANIETVVDAGPIAVVDGHDAMGQVIAAHATRDAINRAKKHGVGVVAVRNSNHFGTVMYFSLMGPPNGSAIILSTNASPAMAPWGGRKKAIGTNPWSIAVPAGRHAPMVLDIANTSVARGKIYLAKQKGIKIPSGWAINADGEPTTDPMQALAGLVLPMAEHKGYAIAVLMDVLSGVLTGSSFGSGVYGPYQSKHRSGCGHLIIALDIASFLPISDFADRMEHLIAELKSVPTANGHTEIFYPGEMEARNDSENRRNGLRLPEETMRSLNLLAQEFSIQL